MHKQECPQSEAEDSNANLPALIPSTSLVLNRTRTAFQLMQDAVHESSANYWYELAKKAVQNRSWQEANYLLCRCLKQDPTHWHGRLQLGFVSAYQNDSKKASILICDAFSEAFSQSYGWWDIIGGLASIQTDAVSTVLQQCIELNQDAFWPTIALALINPETCLPCYDYNINQAKRDLRNLEITCKEQALSSSMYHYICGEYSKAIMLSPSNPVYHNEYGFCSYYKQDYRIAVGYFDAAIELNPKYLRAFAGRSASKQKLGDLTGAAIDYKQAKHLYDKLEYPPVFSISGWDINVF